MSRRKRDRSATSIELTRRALDDLRGIELYSVEKWGRKVADKYLDDVAAALDRIRANPEILSLEPDFVPGLYFYRVKKHILVCDYRERLIIVLAVVHTSMDLPSRLHELEPRLTSEAELLRSFLDQQSQRD